MTSDKPVRFERASGNDLVELVCDTTGTSMQVAAVLVLDTRSPVGIAAVREAIAERVKAAPRLRQRLVDAPFGCGGPVWIDDPAFDIGDHVMSATCPAPGGEQALLGIVAEAITTRLARDRPLWSVTLVTGLSPARSALVVVFHHVLADGIGGLAVLAHLVDGAPVAPDDGFPRRAPRCRELAADAARARARAVGRLPIELGRLKAAIAESGIGRRARAPHCSLNQPTGTKRALAVARVDLTALHEAARAQGGTINDAVLSAVAGALRTVLTARGEDVDRLVVSVPVSSRRQAEMAELGNRVGAIPVGIPTTGDPIRRLAAIARITRQRKTAAPGSSAILIGWTFRALAKIGVHRWFVDRQRLVNTFVSDLHGPDHAMSFLGAPVVDLIPVSGISGNVTVAFAALSYAGTLTVTVIADPDRVPDLDDLAEALRQELHAQG
ncbi:wax ester/triacylglycerol synthase domain-containing protein [Umezawaea sp. Da 62-37]|uniref:wax ester/triacylglycerol synthase domain-containing protein n=1 Tax=Umezawaea sp. Da 62-37 TaxID=3075927 RepID=UPI0028F6CB75|nr:wax ester/triacylglycerol synthase domain-containing protein [Umezawaea sp. Da 62-37]WNV87462.1 wax ester/triacylglycerol synthase family O-acyltransferase [Umezawaea sp. Da 62-37]